MSIIQWQSTFELNIKEFDDHHKHLVDLLNSLHDSILSKSCKEKLGVIIGELIDYSVYHFTAEERWMEEHKYPGFPQHRDEHIAFTRKVSQFQKDFNSGKVELTLDVLTFLMDWLIEHILGSDANFGNFARRLSHNDH
ncbi:MAG: bacteriohemerythrin [Desulfuromonadaceae bacterium]|nr:bacteriohemerythrin [Desulfuromonadaceae bacterium]MDD5106427.1 bacteriohemerythrin [Desulfuromonadaceae bacterium]